MTKKYTKKKEKPSDKFWKETFMKVLETLYWEEGQWAIEEWQKFGVSVADRRKVEAEFKRYLTRENARLKQELSKEWDNLKKTK